MAKKVKTYSKKELRKMFDRSDWTVETLQQAAIVIERIGKEHLGLEIYHNAFEIVTAEQLIDKMSRVGLPTGYDHWSFGKEFVMSENGYKRGQTGLSYEMVINSNPCISYNMEENTTCLMLLVMAHAAIGHNTFFKNNYLFKMWTSADAIEDYMNFARKYIQECEDLYGYDEVEEILDACHALQNYGVDKYKHPPKLSAEKEEARRRKIVEDDEHYVNEIWRTLPKKSKGLASGSNLKTFLEKHRGNPKFPSEPQENILYFLEKNSPNLKPWQREIIRICRKIAQYFFPQGQTKVSNEGMACWTHYHIINKMYEEGYLTDGFMLEFYEHHTAVVAQPGFTNKYYRGFNPYALGFNIYRDIERMCKEPTDEDRAWFPNLAGGDWKKEVRYAMENFKDESLISQYLSPKVIRDMKMFSVIDEETKKYYEIGEIHNDEGYRKVRAALSNQYQRDRYVPDIQIVEVDVYGDRTMTLHYTPHNDIMLDDDEAFKCVEYIYNLWGFPVSLRHLFEDNSSEPICEVGLK